MDIEALADFITLAECKSFSKAAALRNITQPAFSRRIQSLETAVGVELIERKNKNFQLTPSGKRFLVHARTLVDAAHSAINEAQSAMTHLAEPVHIVAPSYLSKTFFPVWYKGLQKGIPNLTMRLSHQSGSASIEELRKGLADFALILSAKNVSPCYTFDGLDICRIGTDKMLAVCANHAKKNEHQLLMYQRGTYMSSCANAVLGKKAATSKIVFESASSGLLKEMALAGFGTAVLQESLVEDELVQGYLHPALNTPTLECDILLVRSSDVSPNKKTDKIWALNAT